MDVMVRVIGETAHAALRETCLDSIFLTDRRPVKRNYETEVLR